MSDVSMGLAEASGKYRRIVGRFGGERPGPLLIATVGIHGNEPAGVEAAERLVRRLEEQQPDLRGEVVVVTGNLPALDRRSRYIDKDLNRIWTEERLALVRAAEDREAVEEREQHALLEVFRKLPQSSRGQVYFIDLHTCSADGPPFVTVGDTLRNRRFALHFPLPIILGLEEQVDGAILEYANNFGCITLGVEAGRHDDPRSVDYHESVLWLALAGAGILDPRALPDFEEHRQRLAKSGPGAPHVIEVRRRHAVTGSDNFRMLPGFANFQKIGKGQQLAEDSRGPIHAREGGRVLLPLYQDRGNDGFFICREVSMFWLRLSAVLRTLRLVFLARLLPGVRRHPQRGDVLIVNTKIARYYPLEIFHLFGYRKLRKNGTKLFVTRRRFDLTSPPQITLS